MIKVTVKKLEPRILIKIETSINWICSEGRLLSGTKFDLK